MTGASAAADDTRPNAVYPAAATIAATAYRWACTPGTLPRFEGLWLIVQQVCWMLSLVICVIL